MIVLGWSWQDALLPEGVQVADAGPLVTLVVPAHLARDARARLALQLAIFEGGADFLPSAPNRAVSVEVAQKMPRDLLCARLRAIAGMAQFTLSLSYKVVVEDTASNGRVWLARRKAKQAIAGECENVLRRVSGLVGSHVSATRKVNDAVQCDLLTPRLAVSDLHHRVDTATREISVLQNARLVVSGPWPAFGFSNITESVAA